MKKLSILVSLPGENKYLAEQAAVAQATAQKLAVDLRLMNAHSDPVSQSQQLLEVIQSPSASRPDAIIVEPATESGLPRVADAAVSAGIGWVVSNARVDYLEQLRRNGKVPVFSISQDHSEIGRLQARQFGALLPDGGTVLYLRGPGTNYLASQRAEGIEAAAPRNVRVKALKIQWTEENCFQSVSSWLRLGTTKAADIGLISSQNTDFVSGARRAFQGVANAAERMKWLALPCTGAGVLSQTKPLVDSGVLAAAAVTSVTMDLAVEMLVKALQGGSSPAEHTFVSASSYPNLEDLARKHVPRAAAATAK